MDATVHDGVRQVDEDQSDEDEPTRAERHADRSATLVTLSRTDIVTGR